VGQPAPSLSSVQPPTSAPIAVPRRKSVVREYAEALLIALALALFIRTFIIQAYEIPSGSMEPTLLVGDHILVNKLIYGLRMPDSIFGLHPPGLPYGRYLLRFEPVHRGDILVFVFPPDPTKDFIKRVIGLPGDTIEVRNGLVYLNGARMADPHAHYELDAREHTTLSPRDNFGPVKVPAGKLFMMGDNRDRSYDGRFWGFVDRDEVEGRAVIIYWSWDTESLGMFRVRWERFGTLVR